MLARGDSPGLLFIRRLRNGERVAAGEEALGPAGEGVQDGEDVENVRYAVGFTGGDVGLLRSELNAIGNIPISLGRFQMTGEEDQLVRMLGKTK